MILQTVIGKNRKDTRYYIKAGVMLDKEYTPHHDHFGLCDALIDLDESLLGNSLLVESSPLEMTQNITYDRVIHIGDLIFLKAQLFVRFEGQLYQLSKPDGFLKLPIESSQMDQISKKIEYETVI